MADSRNWDEITEDLRKKEEELLNRPLTQRLLNNLKRLRENGIISNPMPGPLDGLNDCLALVTDEEVEAEEEDIAEDEGEKKE